MLETGVGPSHSREILVWLDCPQPATSDPKSKPTILPPSLDWNGASGRCVQVVSLPAATSLTPPAPVAVPEVGLPPLPQPAVSRTVTGKCDIAAAGMTIKPEGAKVIAFSVPYFNATQALLIRKGAGYSSLEALKGKRLGDQSGTTGKDYVTSKNPAGVTVTEFEDLATLQQALSTNQIDGAVNDLPVWTDYIRKNPRKFEVGAEFNTGEQYGFGVKKGGNPELLKTVDGVITAAKSDGTYNTIYEKWFGTKPAS